MSNELYQEVILDHNKKPRNYGRLDSPNRTADGFNPLCGDKYSVDINLSGDVIEGIRFHGEGCAISKASASLMSEAVLGKTDEEAREIFDTFQKFVKGEGGEESLGKLKVFSTIWQYPARVKCVILAWHTLIGALDQKSEISTE